MGEIGVYNSVIECIKAYFGESVEITNEIEYRGAGDINKTKFLVLSNDVTVFMKYNSLGNKDFYRAEAAGLMAIAETGAISTPYVIGRGVDKSQNISFLIMEDITESERCADFWEDFGHKLAEMHLAPSYAFTDKDFGFLENNYIGASRQDNTPKDSWIDFFRECRLEPQFRMAERYYGTDFQKTIIKLLDNLPDFLAEPEKPSLLHGDLWYGNYMVGNDGKAWLIDPAVYVGHAEADIAMTELFGGFPREFYAAYSEVNPIDTGYKDRKDLYNLYHLLNHLNLFGARPYLNQVTNVIRKYKK